MAFLFADNLLRTLNWTFIHSLWIGLLLTVAAALIMLATKRFSPALRYRLLSGLFFLFLLSVIIAFAIVWNNLELQAVALTATDGTVLKPLTVLQQALAWLDQQLSAYGSWIIAIWFVIFISRAARMTNDLWQVSRLKKSFTTTPSQEWQERFAQLCAQLQLTVPVRLLESMLVRVPVVMGHLKPVILVPAGIFTHLPPDEIEAVLLHELAHIRRRDYLVNIIQRITEMVFFFNPGLLWISSLLRSERENCCDDIAIIRTNDRRQYVNALIRFREQAMQSPAYAMGFPGQGSILVQRISRIVYRKNRSLSRFETGFVVVSLMVCLALFTYRINRPIKHLEPSFAALQLETKMFSAGSGFEAIEKVEEKQPNEITRPPVIHRATKTATVTAQPQPAKTTQAPKQEWLPATVADHYNEQMAIAETDKSRAEAEQQRQLAQKQREAADEFRKLAAIARADAEMQRAQAELHRIAAARQREEADRLRQEAEKQREKADALRMQAEVKRKEAEAYRKQAAAERQKADQHRAQNAILTGS